MLRPVKRSGARRYYRPEDIALLERINRLVHTEGYTLRGARQLLEAEARHTRHGAQPRARHAGRQPNPPVPTDVEAAPLATSPSVTAPIATAGQSASAPTLPPLDVANRLRAIRSTLADALRAS